MNECFGKCGKEVKDNEFYCPECWLEASGFSNNLYGRIAKISPFHWTLIIGSMLAIFLVLGFFLWQYTLSQSQKMIDNSGIEVLMGPKI